MNATERICLSTQARRMRGTACVFSACAVFFFLAPALLAYAINGRSVAEKVATGAVQPLFIAIVSLLAVAGVFLLERRCMLASLAGLVGIGLWVSSTDATGGYMVVRWERQIQPTAWSEIESLDYVVVLGGGTGKRPDGSAQLQNAGDRVVAAARLYHRGLAHRLICTGDVLVVKASLGAYEDLDRPTNQTREIWRELGVPEEIVESLGGENTSSEMRALADRPEWWREKRCGVVTSAYHMPRAMKLAESHGMSLVPIPCNYFYRSPLLTVDSFMPKPSTLMDVTYCLKEWMGMVVGR